MPTSRLEQQLISRVTQGWIYIGAIFGGGTDSVYRDAPQLNVLDCFCPAVICCRDEELMKQFTDERDVLESQIEMLQ